MTKSKRVVEEETESGMLTPDQIKALAAWLKACGIPMPKKAPGEGFYRGKVTRKSEELWVTSAPNRVVALSRINESKGVKVPAHAHAARTVQISSSRAK